MKNPDDQDQRPAPAQNPENQSETSAPVRCIALLDPSLRSVFRVEKDVWGHWFAAKNTLYYKGILHDMRNWMKKQIEWNKDSFSFKLYSSASLLGHAAGDAELYLDHSNPEDAESLFLSGPGRDGKFVLTLEMVLIHRDENV